MMVINDLETSAPYRLVSVLETLREHHNVSLDFTKSNFDELMEISDQCATVKVDIVESASHNSYHNNMRYQEASLIQEAIRLFLSEVAPKRLNRRKKNK